MGPGGGAATWLKVQFFEDVTDVSSPLSWLTFVAHPVLTFAGLALVPRIFRRFGKGYGVYALLLIGLSALSTKNFFGMSRYLLAAFPCFAVAGELVADRPACAGRHRRQRRRPGRAHRRLLPRLLPLVSEPAC